MKFATLFNHAAQATSLFFILFLGINLERPTAQTALLQTEGVSMPITPVRSVFDEMLAVKSDNITITTDLEAVVAGKNSLKFHPAKLVFGKNQAFEIELRPRGKFRRKVCEFPPLKVKFSKKDLTNAGFSKLNNFKLVTHCADSDAGDQLLAREILPYLMYAELTNISHRVRLVDVTYIDSKNEKNRIKRLGILLEDDDELAARLGGSVVDSIYNLPNDSLNLHLTALNALFEYMIGNTDWSIEGVRNIKFLRPASGGKICPVPYDFDFSGFVNAAYATPNSDLPIKHVRERYFQGASLPPDVIRRAAQVFHKRESKLHAIIDEAAMIDEAQKEELNAYIDSFFHILNKSNDVPVNKSPVAQR